MPRRDPARPLVLAHRGASRRHRENTLEAFEAARAEGADGVELDVHRSADGALVVHHDAAVEGFGVLAEHPLERIRTDVPYVPTLPEVLDVCAGLLVNIEIKNMPGDDDFDADETVAALVVDLLRERGGADDVLVSSFHLPTIDRVKELDAGLRTAYLTVLEPPPIAAVDVAEARGHDAVHPFFGVLTEDTAADIVLHAHALGVDVNTWTVNAPEDVARLAAVGVDGIITDTPADALGAVEAAAS